MRAKEFGRRHAAALKDSGRSKLSFAKELQARRDAMKAKGEPPLRKVDRSALYAFLQGRDFPPTDTLAEMAEILGVRLGWLAEGEEPIQRDLPECPPPIWLVDGNRGPQRLPGPGKRAAARDAFQVHFFSRSKGFEESKATVRLIFQELLEKRLARRRDRGDRGPSDPVYRANTARSLYLKCFLDVSADLPAETTFSSPAFTAAFLSKVPVWVQDEGN